MNNSLKDYFPILVIFSVVLVATMALEYRDRTWSWMEFGEHFMGLFLIVFSMFKLFDLQGFAEAFENYDIAAQRIPNYSFAYPFIELVLGCFYLSQTWVILVNIVTAAVMITGLVGIIDSIVNKKGLSCACLGTTLKVPLSTVTVMENSLMAIMAIAMLFARL